MVASSTRAAGALGPCGSLYFGLPGAGQPQITSFTVTGLSGGAGGEAVDPWEVPGWLSDLGELMVGQLWPARTVGWK